MPVISWCNNKLLSKKPRKPSMPFLHKLQGGEMLKIGLLGAQFRMNLKDLNGYE